MKINNAERASLLSVIGKFTEQHIVLLGDLVADEFVYGEITRVSREAPVLILKERQREVVPGGGANAANNLVDLGAQLTLVGGVGDDEAGTALIAYFRAKDVSTRHVITVRGFSTPVKTRILGGLSHWQRQQIVRIDREPAQDVDRKSRRKLSASIIPLLKKASAMLVSDYGFGSTDAPEVEYLRRRAGNHRLPMTVDSRYDLLKYSHLTAATPNEPELEAAYGKKIGNNLELLHQLGQKTLHRQWLRALLVTRGRDGMVLFEARRKPEHIPIFGSDQVTDVTGAGDTVMAAFTLALAAGATFLQAAQLANCAGGLVVMKRGTATVNRHELEEAIRNA
ncbi:MAG TPA: bifunctional ADP-heptose synthase [Terriglobia bacterium]|nr:bifunctional ADP-heptose synthase [Terriglobia bacterium]